jgi:hypothetical protein
MPILDEATQYLEAVNSITRAWLKLEAQAFAKRYRPEQPTVLLLPGGMASQMYRYPTKLEAADLPLPEHLDLEGSPLIWISPGSILAFLANRYADLFLDPSGVEEERYPCFAGGALDIPLASPYPATRAAFEAAQINYVEMGYDWRLSPLRAAERLKEFLPMLRDAAVAKGLRSPLEDLTIVGHSYGGVVAKLFVDLVGEAAFDYYRRIITVAAPFCGTVNHANRYIVGATDAVEFAIVVAIAQHEMGVTTKPAAAWEAGVDRMRQMVACFPGLYPLITAPESLLGPDVRERLGLEGYPVTDAQGRPFDLFAHAEELPWSAKYFSGETRDDVVDDYVRIAAPLSARAASRFHCIGGVGVGRLEDVTTATLQWTTPGRITVNPDQPWRSLNAQAPLSILGTGHDGTVPLWSARPAWLPEDQFRVVSGVDHKGIIKDRAVLRTLIEAAQGAFWTPEPLAGGTRMDTAAMLDELGAVAGDQSLDAIARAAWGDLA